MSLKFLIFLILVVSEFCADGLAASLDRKETAELLEVTEVSQCFKNGKKVREDGICESVWDE